jgi:hypothetical protein
VRVSVVATGGHQQNQDDHQEEPALESHHAPQ